MDFLKRNKFWVIIGLLVVASGVALGFFAKVRARSSELTGQVTQKAQALSQYAEQGDIVSEDWIESARQQQAAWEQEMNEARRILARMDQPIEQYFRDPDRPERTEPLEAGMWKMVYADKVRRLQQQVEDSFAMVGTGTPLVSRSYRDEWPPEEEMRAAEKEYWIQKNLIDALAALNAESKQPVVPVFDRFRFAKRPERLLHPSDGSVFRPIPFEIEVATTFPNVPRVLSALMAGDVNVRVTGLAMARSERSGPRKPTGGETPAPMPQPVSAPGAPSRRERPTGAPPGAGVPPEVLEMLGERGVPFGPPAEIGGRPTASERRAEERAAEPEGEKEPEPTAKMPANLVDVTIRGYVLDYTGKKQEGE